MIYKKGRHKQRVTADNNNTVTVFIGGINSVRFRSHF